MTLVALCCADLAGAILRGRHTAAVAAAPVAPAAPAATNATSPPQERAKLDVGFGDFERNVTTAMVAAIKSNLTGSAWNDELRGEVAGDLSGSLHMALQGALKPLKLSIGQTWMVFHNDEEKEAYVSQLRSSFEPVMTRARDSVLTHIGIGLRHASGLKAADGAKQLVQRAEKFVISGLLEEHCYDEHRTKKANGTAAPDAGAKPEKFCIPDVITSFVKRLNDTQGLVSMTMRFEARALALAQQRAKGAAAKEAPPHRV